MSVALATQALWLCCFLPGLAAAQAEGQPETKVITYKKHYRRRISNWSSIIRRAGKKRISGRPSCSFLAAVGRAASSNS